MTEKPKARLIAFYLPQYHPIPENDRWWGKGFSEWRTVAQAKPLFPGHYQPRLPADLGFYDLRVPETRRAQADLAKEYGIEGFCYWHYWFAGKRLLERPFEEMLKSGEPDFPFCLAWANHSWSGIWFGGKGKTLIEQTYPGSEDHEAHFQYLLPAFLDCRYLSIEGKPIFIFWKPRRIPEIQNMIALWRNLAARAGLKGLYLIGCDLTQDEIKAFGMDGSFYAYQHKIADVLFEKKSRITKMADQLYRKYSGRPQIYSYRNAMKYFLKEGSVPLNEYPSLVSSWDSSPRIGFRGVALKDCDPELFRLHVREALAKVEHKPLEQRILFIKSWNEWSEGNYLEPDLKYGMAYLQILKEEMAA